MEYHFTPGSQRALNYASGWSNRNGCDELQAQALLLGLLSEPECRAAAVLARFSIDIPAVRQHWPQFVNNESANGGAKSFSPEIEISLRSAVSRLTAFPRPLELATEHLLLGLAAADHEVSAWLRGRGLDPDALDAEIHRVHGYEYGPVDYEEAGSSAEPLSADLYVYPEDPGATAAATAELASGAPAADFAPETPPSEFATRGQPAEFASKEPASEFASAAPLLEFNRGAAPENVGMAASEETATFRVLDAAANRAREALRVVEDYVRFLLDDRHLTELCKQFRHDLTNALSWVSPQGRIAARETQADVGTSLTTVSEQTRGQAADVLVANFARLQESLRSLEEFGKVFHADLAASFKQLRYRGYTLQRSVDITRGSIERLAAARLYVLIDGRASAEEFRRLAGALIAAGVDVLQLRDKRLGDRELLDRARLLGGLTRGTKTLFVVNDRPDLAALAQADGVHVGQEEVSVKDARSIVGPAALIGVSAHSIEQARQAVLDGANYLGVGPTFPSATKQFPRYPGVDLLWAVAAEIRLPAFAIGGITRDNLAEVLATGLKRVAVSAAVTAAADPATTARQLAELLA